jgi:hypothetical protein
MKKILVLSALLFTLTFAFWGCGPDDSDRLSSCENASIVYLPEEVKDYFNFNVGTYWIYRDSLSSLEDSIWVRTSTLEVDVEPQLKKICWENYYCSYSSLIYGRWLCRCIFNNPYASNKLIDIGFSNTDDNTDIARFEYINEAFVSSTAEGGIVSMVDSILVRGELYKNILYLNYPNDTRQAEYYKKAYYSPHLGLVKCITRNGRVWELVRFNIKI